MKAPEPGELTAAQLEDALRRGEILKAMLAEVKQLVGIDQRCRCSRNQHLPTVAGGSNAGGAMNVGSDIALRSQVRGASVDADTNSDRAGRE